MRNKLLLEFSSIMMLLLLMSCSTSKKLMYPEIKVIQLESEELYLYTDADTTSQIANTIKKGSILFHNSNSNDYLEVYTKNPNYISKEYHKDHKYYIHKAKYSPYTLGNHDKTSKIVELPYDSKKSYIRGERGGCYYMNTNGNRQYVNRSYCSRYNKPAITKPIKKTKTYKSKSYSSTCGARTKSGGYCKRKVSGGGRCWQH